MTARWEYMTLSYKRHYGRTDYVVNGFKESRLKDKVLADVMNMLGDQGWEFVAVSDAESHEFTFKRPKTAKNASPQPSNEDA